MNNLIKILTAGSVDDGKSTLLGHLLSNINAIYEDQLEGAYNNGILDYSLLLDGLSSEREQGITIDVCYRYFYLNNNKIVLADVPGHEQYTHNMITAATFADMAILLIDARHGILQQTKRHSFILSMLGVKNVIITVNKMDLVDYSEDIFNNIRKEYEKLNKIYNFDIKYIPISALVGDNITEHSENMKWYNGTTIYDSILHVGSKEILYNGLRLPIQYVFKNGDERYYSGKLIGEIKVGDEVTILPAKKKSIVTSVYANGIKKEECKNENVAISISDEIDISRGDVLIKDASYDITNNITSQMIWFSDNSLDENKNYYIKHLNKVTRCKISKKYKIDINTNEDDFNTEIKLNDIFFGDLELSYNIICTKYSKGKNFGSFIIIDPETNNTCGAGIITEINSSTKINTDMFIDINEISTNKDDIYLIINTIDKINKKFGLNIKTK